MMRERLAKGLAAGALALVACSSSRLLVDPADDAPAEDTADLAARRCAPAGPRFYAFLRSGTCEDVEGAGGRWQASPLFPNAPGLHDEACTYLWSAPTPPDVGALDALDATHLTPARATTSCTALPAEGIARITPPRDAEPEPPTGVTGCDVCAELTEAQRLVVILPSHRQDLLRATVETTDGRFVTFDLTPPASAAQVFDVALPPDRAGAVYKPGTVKIFQAR